ncbi:MAG: glutamate--tRNA ligase family protein [Zavarzinella sp.]
MIRTRFAPSPTGFLHVGGVRTALFSWLLVQRLGGQFILRIDDTDEQRNQVEALQPILDGFQWLGLTWDEGPSLDGATSHGPHAPYFQSQRNQLYVDAAEKLLAAGLAYPDYMTKEELEADRDKAKAAKKPYIHRGPLRDADPASNLQRYREQPAPLRFKVDAGRTIQIDDMICGAVEQRADLIGDPVILRAPNEQGIARPLYNFASVVDDIDMKITHIIRAREHLSNTYTQLLMFEALQAPLPRFGHVPVVNRNGKKMSKRDLPPPTEEERTKLMMLGWTNQQIDDSGINLATVAYYKELGYLPQALVNYLGRLGWSLDDKSELIPLPEMIQAFDMETGIGRINDSPGEFDPKKLFWVQDEYMKQLPHEEKLHQALQFLQRANVVANPPTEQEHSIVDRVVQAAGDRMKIFSDILFYATPLLHAPVYQAKAVEKHLSKPAAQEHLAALAGELAAAGDWTPSELEQVVHRYCEAKAIKMKEIVQPLRVALIGMEVGFSLYDTIAILGKEQTLERIQNYPK